MQVEQETNHACHQGAILVTAVLAHENLNECVVIAQRQQLLHKLSS